MRNVECFVAGIVKGIKEHDDPSRHFGSTLALHQHFTDAENLGLVTGEIKQSKICNAQLTTLGEAAYSKWKLASMPDGRSYLWPQKTFDIDEVSQDVWFFERSKDA
jgi:hypothetical protein